MRTCNKGSPSLARVPSWSRKTDRAQGPKAISSVWRGSPLSRESLLSVHKKNPAQGGVSSWLKVTTSNNVIR